MANFIIIGATSGIGKAISQQLLTENHGVSLCGRDEIGAQPFVQTRQLPYFCAEASDFDAMDRVFSEHLDTIGPIDGVVNCAGSLILKSADKTSFQEYMAIMQANTTTAFATVRAAGKYMTAGSSVLLISSAAALVGLANHEAIACAKAAIIGLTLSAAASYATKNIRVNALAPGLVNTPLTHGLINTPQNLAYSQALHPLGRIGSPDDIAKAACFLLNPDNHWITGQILAIDGGLSSIRAKIKI